MSQNNSTPLKIKAKLGFHGVLDTELVKALTVAYNGLLHNPAFPNTPVDLAVYKAGIDTLSSLIADAEDGGTKAITAKDKQRVVMIKMYTLLGHYAESACNDDPAIFSTSGFTPVTTVRTAAKPLTEAKFGSIDRGSNSGEIVVKPQSEPGVLTFDVRFALESAGGVLGTWTVVTIAGPKKTTITGLTALGTYHFQIRAFGKVGGYTDWMDSKTLVCL
jgi:hypothetical protein